MAEIDQQPGKPPTATVMAASQTSMFGRIRNYFLTGLVVAGPVLITAYLTWSFITWVDSLVRPLIPPQYRPETYLPGRSPAPDWSSPWLERWMGNARNALKNACNFLCQPSKRYPVLLIALASLLAGVILWGGFNTAMEATNRLEFCISCHEMRDNVYPEYKKSIHYSNRTGVRAICSDCHVPKDWVHKLKRKIEASAEFWGKLTGTIDTQGEIRGHRLELAKQEWARMKASDSRECRNCHSYEGMKRRSWTCGRPRYMTCT